MLLVELGEHTMECRAASHDLVKAQPIEVAKFPMNGGPLASPGGHGQEPRLRFDVLGLWVIPAQRQRALADTEPVFETVRLSLLDDFQRIALPQ